MSTMTARFAGTCASTGRAFTAGATIDYDRATKRAVLVEPAKPGAAPAPKTERTGRYSRYGSNYARFASGAEAYANKRGRCEDAPCCGCCN